MMTRRQARNLEPLEVEVVDVLSTADLPSPTENLSDDLVDTSGIELDDLFGLEDFSFSWAQDSKSPFYELSNVDEVAAKDPGDDTGPCPPRKPSALKVGPRQNKNAIAARLNRLRKKEYVNSLEKKVGLMASENNVLKQQNSELTKRVEELEDETRYLRAVLANESVLAQLLSRLSGVNGMKLSSSLSLGHDSNDHDYALQRKRVKVEEKETSGGVCLHVDKNHISVEFCTKCAESASTLLKM
ncbi:CREB/ATF bZIP transcription factor isoform 1-T3 [Synchiropus picturatus]